LAGGIYNVDAARDHHCRIAASSIRDCEYWSQKYAGCRDLQTILRDEAVESDDDSNSAASDSDEPLAASWARSKAKSKKN
jgi:hypothetical protein